MDIFTRVLYKVSKSSVQILTNKRLVTTGEIQCHFNIYLQKGPKFTHWVHITLLHNVIQFKNSSQKTIFISPFLEVMKFIR